MSGLGTKQERPLRGVDRGPTWFGRRLYTFGRGLGHLYFRVLFRFRVEGSDRVPPSGPCLLVSNHQSFFDPNVVGCCVPNRQMLPLAKAGLFRLPVLGRLIRAVGAIPVYGAGRDAETMRIACERLIGGGTVAIFPEGGRSWDDTVQPFKPGVMLLVKKAKPTVVPIAIDGAHRAWPRGRALPRCFGRMRALVGAPIPAEELLQGGARRGLHRLEHEVRVLYATLRDEPVPELPESLQKAQLPSLDGASAVPGAVPGSGGSSVQPGV